MSGRLKRLNDLNTTFGLAVVLSSDEWLSMLSRFVLMEWIPLTVSGLGNLIGEVVAGSLAASMALAAAAVAAFCAAAPRNLEHDQYKL